MRTSLLLALFTLLLPAPALAADTEIKPVVCWYPQPEYSSSGVPERSVRLIGTAKEFEKFWKDVFPKEMLPEVNFEENFVVIVTQVLGYNFSKLTIDERGDGKLPQGPLHNRFADDRNSIAIGSSIAVFPRSKVKTVDGKKLSPVK
jgi:hypothetical protein